MSLIARCESEYSNSGPFSSVPDSNDESIYTIFKIISLVQVGIAIPSICVCFSNYCKDCKCPQMLPEENPCLLCLGVFCGPLISFVFVVLIIGVIVLIIFYIIFLFIIS